ncbi:PD40 domain-containing protein [Candidatus Woesearchaeota archaeon]|nr:PD40 domain-containing protein [Candidatus Woesearchaeota archaeon]
MQEEVAPERDLEGLINDALDSKEPIKKPQTEQIRPQGLLERIILSRWAAPAYAAAMGAFEYLIPKSPSPDQTDNLFMSGLIAGLGYITAKLLRQDWLLRKAEPVRRKTRPFPSKLFNLLPEHPEIIAGGVAAYFTANLVSPMFTSITPSDLFRHPEVIPTTLQLSGYLASMLFSIAYSGISLALGRVFHPETFKTVFQASAAAINAWREKYGKAANDIGQLLQTQRSYGKGVSLQALAGDFQSLGNDEKFIETDYNAFLTDRTHHAGRSDWALGPFIYLLKKIVLNKAKKLPPHTGKPALPYLIAGTEAFAGSNLAAADTFLASAVQQDRHEFLPHAFRAAFLRRTGRNRSADLQMRVCAEIVMQQDAKFEPVEGSRNEVFLAGNVALKRNTDPQNLVKEGEVIGKFREKNGTAVIYPLPVYKRGDYYYLTSEKAISETPFDLIKQRRVTLEDFAQAIVLMVQLQRSGMELYNAGELELDDRVLRLDASKPETLYFAQRRLRAIEQIERFNGVRLPESYKSALGHGLSFVDEKLASSKLLTLYKDFNPKNVLKRPFGSMQALDFEPSSLRLLPPQADIVNLLEFVEYLQPRHKALLTELFISQFEKENKVKVDRAEFYSVYEFAAFQWHYERLIYRPEEAAKALTEERREEKKKDQVRHLLSAREHLETIVAKGYASGDDLKAALNAKEELNLPIFPDKAEYDRLCSIVERERESLLSNEPLPISKTQLALASAGAFAILTASVVGAVAIRNNLVPILNVPVFPQGDKVLLTVSEVGANGRWQEGPGKVKYFVIDAEHDTVSFLTDADNTASADLSAFQDKAVFIKDEKITLYDFLNREFRSVTDKRFENPAISPDGLWIASNVQMKYIDPVAAELWQIRPSNMHTEQITDFPNAFLPRYDAGKSWSPDGSYLAFLSNNEKVQDKSYPDPSKVWVNTVEPSSGRVYQGPFVSNRGRGIFAWSPNGSLAYLAERQGEEQRIYLSDKKLENTKEIYFSNGTNMRNIAFIGADHLVLGTSKQLLLLNIATLELTTLKDAVGGLLDVSKSGNRFLYECNAPSDVCEFDLETGQSVNLTNTPGRRELSAVYAPNKKKIFVASVPDVDCVEEGCPPSLSVIDFATGKSKRLMNSGNGNLRYTLIPP